MMYFLFFLVICWTWFFDRAFVHYRPMHMSRRAWFWMWILVDITAIFIIHVLMS